MRRSLSGEGRELQTLLPRAGTVPAARSTKLEVAELSSPKDETSHPKCPLMACAVTRRRFPVGASPTRQSLQPEAIGAVMEVTKWLKQAATRVNAEQSSKRTMRRSTRQPYRGRLIRLDEMSEAIRSHAAPGQWRHVHKESARNTGSPMA
jgi:hypothetical protein